jgi:hypothetical protein
LYGLLKYKENNSVSLPHIVVVAIDLVFLLLFHGGAGLAY